MWWLLRNSSRLVSVRSMNDIVIFVSNSWLLFRWLL